MRAPPSFHSFESFTLSLDESLHLKKERVSLITRFLEFELNARPGFQRTNRKTKGFFTISTTMHRAATRMKIGSPEELRFQSESQNTVTNDYRPFNCKYFKTSALPCTRSSCREFRCIIHSSFSELII